MSERISLTELQLIIRDTLYTTLAGQFWVHAEISEIRENTSGHCYLELIDKKQDTDDVKSRARAVIWGNKYRILKPLFENATGESLKSGMKILLKVSVEYHELYGLSLVVYDIDPAYTAGEMALRKQQIIRRLSDEGVIEMNKELPFPMFPKRIAVISSKNAAGYTDFIKQLENNVKGYTFFCVLFEAIMQGQETSLSVINALDQIYPVTDRFDAVVIIRGGGSQTDLSWFDNYDLAFHIAQFPLPVVTGIGHEKDLSVSDIVANTSVKTPTAAADLLIDHMSAAENYINNMAVMIKVNSEAIIAKKKNILALLSKNLIPVARFEVAQKHDLVSKNRILLYSLGKEMISNSIFLTRTRKTRIESAFTRFLKEKDKMCTDHIRNLKVSTIHIIDNKKRKITAAEVVIKIGDPVNVLKRGFSITYHKGKIVTSGKLLAQGDLIETQFTDGQVKSKVSGFSENRN